MPYSKIPIKNLSRCLELITTSDAGLRLHGGAFGPCVLDILLSLYRTGDQV
jgi:hypothetical protein